MEAALRQRCKSEDQWATQSDVILDGCKIRNIDANAAEHLSKFIAVEVLCLNQTSLCKIDEFPVLPKLKILELQDNMLSARSNLDTVVDKLNQLQDLSLAGNKFQNVEDLTFLKSFPKLRRLELELNPVAVSDPDSYRTKMFELVPQLTAIDNVNKQGVADEDEDDDDDDDDDDDAPAGDAVTADGVATGDTVTLPKEEGDDEATLKDLYAGDLDSVDEDEDFEPEDEDDDDEDDDEDDDDDDEDGDDDDGDDDEDEDEVGRASKRGAPPSSEESDNKKLRR
eukprot:CAMPEP_0113846148 /NCGR_PEP_ID=MMETSP0372-20130328/1148_1 /TAXON_ID=340204 /ORGANISM="Lankesteria abbotti" /LENGTH=281 /DNA_ID=CAMNT_0000815263 /DNA_START=73 /DNA_END=918 /DNA_ORIENTATION=- /assembly_acc=CAM_ASM_000359